MPPRPSRGTGLWPVAVSGALLLGLLAWRVPWLALMQDNVAWLFLTRSLYEEDAAVRDTYGWQAAVLFETVSPRPSARNETMYGRQLAELALQAGEVAGPESWNEIPDQPRALVHLLSALRISINGLHEGENVAYYSLTAKRAADALLNHGLLPGYQAWTCPQIMEWIALAREAQNQRQHDYWAAQLQAKCPDLYPSYRAQNPSSQVVLALAYGRLGMYERAIDTALNALEQQDWHWANFVLAGLYQDTGRLDTAEYHYLQAVELAMETDAVPLYLWTLAEFYRDQDRLREAAVYHCAVITDASTTTRALSLKERSQLSLQEMLGVEPAGVQRFCNEL